MNLSHSHSWDASCSVVQKPNELIRYLMILWAKSDLAPSPFCPSSLWRIRMASNNKPVYLLVWWLYGQILLLRISQFVVLLNLSIIDNLFQVVLIHVTMGLLSPEEKIYVVHGAEQGLRTDGRQRYQYRPIEIETDLIPSAMGSARVKIGDTDVVACVKANTFTPSVDKPKEGQLSLLIHFSGVCMFKKVKLLLGKIITLIILSTNEDIHGLPTAIHLNYDQLLSSEPNQSRLKKVVDNHSQQSD